VKFAVQLVFGAAKPLQENVPACFQGDVTRIRRIGEDWFLESSAFDACTTPAEVLPIADRLVKMMHRLTALHGRLFQFCEVGYVQILDDAGAPNGRMIHGTTRVQIYRLEGIQELQTPEGEQSRGAALVAAAMTDKKLQEALALIGDGYELEWAQIYNILEFLGGVDTIVEKKWATRKEVRKCRQTANHYGHLGSPKKYPLPPTPPSQGEATILVFNLLKKWISEQFTGGCK
jgi:hypothetical protein